MIPSRKRKHNSITVILLLLSLVILFSSGAMLYQFATKSPISKVLSAELEGILGRGWMTSATWTDDGQTVAIGSSTGVWLYASDDLDTTQYYLPSDSAPVSSVAFSSDNTYLVEGRWDNRAYVWRLDNLTQPHQVLRGHRGFVNDVAVHPNNQWIATASTDKTIRLWDVETGETTRIFEGHDHSVTTIDIHAEGHLLASGSRDGLNIVWDIDTGEPVVSFQQVPEVIDVKFDEDNQHLLTLDANQFKTVYSIETGEIVAGFVIPDDTLDSRLANLDTSAMGFHPPVNTLAISPDGKTVAVGMGNIFIPDNHVLVWDLEAAELIALYAPQNDTLDNVITLAYQPDSTTLAIGDTAGNLHLWDYASDGLINSWQAHAGELLSMTFTDVHTLVTGGADAMIQVWEVATSDNIAQFESPNGAVHNITFDKNISFAQDALNDSLTSYALSDEEQSLNLLCSHGDSIGAVTLNQDASLRATATFNNTVLLTNVASGELLHTLAGHVNLVDDVAFSPDGRWLATASWDRTVRVWHVETGDTLLKLEGHTRPVTSVRFSPDGTRLLSGSDDGTVRVWVLDAS